MNTEKALHGIKVIELSTFIAVPACARYFADNGADVIKIEAKSGDPVRFAGTQEGRPDDPYENTTFDLENANKRGMVLNLKSPEGMKILFQLLKDADIFVTNWRPQALQKAGLDFDTLHEKFPKLVYASFTGYGETGPDKDLPGFDFTAFFARGGLMGSLYQKGTVPMNLVPGIGDHTGGLFLSAGILTALYKAAKTGEGDKVTVDLLHTSIFVQAIMLQAAQYGMGLRYPIDRRDCNNPFNCAFETKDGRFLQLSMPPFDQFFPKFMPLIGRADLVSCEKYTMENMTKNKLNGEFHDIMSAAIKQKTVAEWSEIFEANDIPYALAQVWEEVLEDKQAWATNVFYPMHYDNGSVRTLVRQPVFLAAQGLPDYKRAPLLGEHSESILRDLGYSEEDLTALHKAGVYNTWDDLKGFHNG